MMVLSHQVWRDLGEPDTFEAWHRALHLSDAYAITQIEEVNSLNSSLRHGQYHLTVKSVHLPQRETLKIPDTFNPYYRRDDRGVVELTKIEVWHWTGEKWQVCEVPR